MVDVNDHHAMGNGTMLTKLQKVSPFIVVAVGLAGGYFTSQLSSSIQSAKQDQAIVQLQTGQAKLIQDVEQLRVDVVPRSEHSAMLDDNKTIAHWAEKYNDAMFQNLQHQIDDLKKR